MARALAHKLEEFADCYDAARPIWDRRAGLQIDYPVLDRRPFDALMFFVEYAHQRAGGTAYTRVHRKALLEAIDASSPLDRGVNEQFVAQMEDETFAQRGWETFEKECETNSYKVNERQTKGPIKEVIEKLHHEGKPNLVALLRSKTLEEAYEFLKGIKGLGPKIAALLLRDLWSYVGPWPNTSEDEMYCLQPVDIWVRFWSKRCWDEANLPNADEACAKLIVGWCREVGVNPIRFNMGAWFVGAHFKKLCDFFDVASSFDADGVAQAIEKFV